ncbi:TrbG/VirB9 family P-type conjugative transfer protein [uncultured Roseibium sp.]|uniref:TrbG/VirB9 family P-type conjugative transfer protein n=1 Tax=uncultured Roseibium sp. TaxID=1936171 RepID=UPI00262C6E57|nr:TrbG/VirB9 family P-type conjugative transfer protein [uncultured Roseibium sp.]
MILRFSVFLVAATIAGSAAAQTPLNAGPAVPGAPLPTATPNQRVAAATAAVNSTLPIGSVPQAQAQSAGNFGPLARPDSIGGQIQEAWSRPGKKQGAHVQNYCGDCVYKVRLRQYMVSAIQLPKGVKIKSADLGDSSRFEVKKRSDNTLAVKPTGAGVDSSMLVYTDDGDVYSFYLRAEGINSKTVPDVSFRIIGPQSAGMSFVEFDSKGNPLAKDNTAVATHGSKDFLQTAKFDPAALRGWNNYKLWGDRKLRPEQVFRDDHFTYIQFGDKWNDLELPTAYVVVDGIDELVNTRVQGTTFIVESTHRLITLKSGQSFMCLRYKGAK